MYNNYYCSDFVSIVKHNPYYCTICCVFVTNNKYYHISNRGSTVKTRSILNFAKAQV